MATTQNNQDQGMSAWKGIGLGVGVEAASTVAEMGVGFGGAIGVAAAARGVSQMFNAQRTGTKAGVIQHGLWGGLKGIHSNKKLAAMTYGQELIGAALGGYGLSLMSNQPHNKINSNEATNWQSVGMSALGGGIMGGSFLGMKAHAIGEFPELFQTAARSEGLKNYLSKRKDSIHNNENLTPEQRQSELERVDRYEAMRVNAAKDKGAAINAAKQVRNNIFGNTELGNKIFEKTDGMVGKIAHMSTFKKYGGSILLGAVAGGIYNMTKD
jgi:hypothetical protein